MALEVKGPQGKTFCSHSQEGEQKTGQQRPGFRRPSPPSGQGPEKQKDRCQKQAVAGLGEQAEAQAVQAG